MAHWNKKGALNATELENGILNNNFFIGADFSSRSVHLSVLDKDENILYMVKYTTDLKGQKDRPNDVCDKFIQGIGVDIPEEIVLNSVFITEQPIYLQNVKTTFSIANVIYSFERELWNLNIDYWPVDVGHWKSSVLGNGKADKSDIRNFCTIKWGDRFSEQDWADAACLGLYGVQKFGKGK